MDDTINNIKASINRQLDLHGQRVYKALQDQSKHADGSYMYQYEQHIIDGLQIALNIKICIPSNNTTLPPRPRWRGFSFALHPTRCRAFILSGHNITLYKRLQRVLLRQCNCTSHATKQHTRLYSGFPCGCTLSTAHDTRPTQAAIIQPAPRWSTHTRPDGLQHIPDTTATPERCTGQHRPHIIIRYIRGCSISQTMPARRGLDVSHARRLEVWHRVSGAHRVSPAPSTRRGSPAAGTRRAARNHWRLPPHLFSGFRPIANRGQQ